MAAANWKDLEKRVKRLGARCRKPRRNGEREWYHPAVGMVRFNYGRKDAPRAAIVWAKRLAEAVGGEL